MKEEVAWWGCLQAIFMGLKARNSREQSTREVRRQLVVRPNFAQGNTSNKHLLYKSILMSWSLGDYTGLYPFVSLALVVWVGGLGIRTRGSQRGQMGSPQSPEPT